MRDPMPDANGSAFELLLTSHCNLTCDYCYARFLKKENMRFQDVVRLLHSQKVSKIYFTGGEPLLQFLLMERIVAYAKKNGLCHQFVIRTNGTIMSPKIMAFMKKHRIPVEISLDGGQCAHDIHRRCGREGSFGTIQKNLTKLRKNGIPYSINYTVTPETINGLSRNLTALIRQHPASRIDVGFVFTRHPVERATINRYLDEVRGFIDRYFNDKIYLQNDKVFPMELWFKTLLSNQTDKLKALLDVKCSYHRLRMFPDGDIYPCVASYSLIPSKFRKRCHFGRPDRLDHKRWHFFRNRLDLSRWVHDKDLKGSNRICYLYAKDPVNRYYFERKIVLEGLKYTRKHIERLKKDIAIKAA